MASRALRLITILVPACAFLSILASTMIAGCGKESDSSAAIAKAKKLEAENEAMRQQLAAVQALTVPPTNSPATPAPPVAAAAPTLDQEAAAKARELFEKHWSKCDESYFSIVHRPNQWPTNLPVDETGLVKSHCEELKGVTIKPPPRGSVATEADRLNGIEWKGQFDVSYSAKRQYYFVGGGQNITSTGKVKDLPPNQWSDWRQQSLSKYSTDYKVIHLAKKGGQWIVLKPESYSGRYPNNRLGSIDNALGAATDEVSPAKTFSPIDCNEIQRRGKAIQRVSLLGSSCILYAMEEGNGRLPDDLQSLEMSGLLKSIGPDPLRSPYGPVSGGGSDYWLAAKQPNRMDSKRILIYDRASYESSGDIYVCFDDGHIEVCSLERFLEILRYPANANLDFQLPTRK